MTVNLADLYRQTGRDAEGESVLRAAIATSARNAGLHHALGLTLTRLKRSANTPPAQGDGPTVFAHACKLGLEGIVSKRKDSAYRSGHSADWPKMKNVECTGREARRRGRMGKKKWR